MNYTVKKLAKISGISVRTLHYYDEIGILKPNYVAENGYRYYGKKEMERLQQILFFRELEFSLEDIKKILRSPRFDRVQAMTEQRKLLEIKRDHIQQLIENITKTIQFAEGGEDMKQDDLFNGLSDKVLDEYKAEAKKRWGHTEAYKQSVERSKNWTKEDIKRVQAEWGVLLQSIADVMEKGSESSEAQTAVGNIYQLLNQFYDPNLDMFEGLGQTYVDDPRFRETFEKVRPGLAEFTRDAIRHFVQVKKSK